MRAGAPLAIVIACLPPLFAGCTPAPMQKAGEGMASYIEAKREVAQQLETAFGIKQSNNYRLVAVTGPNWEVGSALDPANPLNPITDACLYAKDKLPKEVSWGGLPAYKSDRTVNLGGGLPPGVAKAFGAPLQANVQLDWSRGGTFALSDLSQIVVPQDDFEKAITSKSCKDGLAGKAALIVRGVVSGKEVFGSTNKLATNAGLHVQTVDLFTVKYNDSATWTLEDKVKSPKLFVVTLVPPLPRSGPITLVPPDPAIIQRMEAISTQ